MGAARPPEHCTQGCAVLDTASRKAKALTAASPPQQRQASRELCGCGRTTSADRACGARSAKRAATASNIVFVLIRNSGRAELLLETKKWSASYAGYETVNRFSVNAADEEFCVDLWTQKSPISLSPPIAISLIKGWGVWLPNCLNAHSS